MRLFTIIAFLAILAFGDFTENVVGANLRISAETEEQAKVLAEFARSCAQMADEVLGFEGRPEKYLRISEGKKLNIRRQSITLSGSATLLENTDFLVKALVERRLQNEHSARFVNFISAAIAYRRLAAMQNAMLISANMDCQAGFTTFSNGHFPNIEYLYSNPIETNRPALFHLYAMHSELFLRCIEGYPRKKRDILEAMMSAQDDVPLEKTFEPFLPKGLALQTWYEQNVALLGRIGNFHTDDTIELIEAICRIPVVCADNPDVVQRIPIEKLANDKIDKASIERCLAQIRQLQKDTPYLLQPGVNAVADALNDLLNGKKRAFRKKFAYARKLLKECEERQKAADELLDFIEKQQISIVRRYSLQFEVFRTYSKQEEELFPWK